MADVEATHTENVPYSARSENSHVKQDWLQHTYSIRHARNWHVKCEWLLALCSEHSENAYVNLGWLQVSLSIRHAQKTHISSYSKIASSLVLIWARTESAQLIKIEIKSRTLFGLDTDSWSVDFLSYFRTL